MSTKTNLNMLTVITLEAYITANDDENSSGERAPEAFYMGGAFKTRINTESRARIVKEIRAIIFRNFDGVYLENHAVRAFEKVVRNPNLAHALKQIVALYTQTRCFSQDSLQAFADGLE